MRIIIKKILSTDDIFIVTGEAGNGIEALAEIEKDIPDIIFLDIEMPEMDGVEALKEIRAKYSTKVVVVSSVAQMGSSRAAEVNQLELMQLLKNLVVQLIQHLHHKKEKNSLKLLESFRIIKIFFIEKNLQNG